ncbi:MAG: nucleotidyltransferase domain-containing protein [Myxococcota bacterium]
MGDRRVTREALVEALRRAVTPLDWVEAAWLGGSDATGRTDPLSDVDLQLLVPTARADDAFAAVEAVLADLGGVSARWDVPEPTWHGHRQRFYQLTALPETAMLDLCVMRRDRLGPFLDPVRHGRPLVWFDRAGALVPTDDPDLEEALRRRRLQLRDRARVIGHLPGKALARGHLVEAVDGLHKHLLGPLVELLRARHAPRRQDFGLRYLDADLPPEVVARLQPLVFVADAEALAAAIAAARTWLDEELVTLSV